MRLRHLLPTLTLVISAAVVSNSHGASPDDLPGFIAPRHRTLIASWLTGHADYRLATDADCSCADDIATVRAGSPPEWPALPNYHPYYAVGDFRGGGAEDFAVGVVSAPG